MMLFFFGGVTLAACQDLRGISLIASEVTNANYYKAAECFILVLARATSGGVEEAYFRHESGCLCPFSSCADHLSVGPSAH